MRDRFRLIDFEPEPTPTEPAAPVTEPTTPPQAAQPAPTPPAATPPEPPTPAPAESWTGPSQEEWERAQQFQQAAAPILQQIATNMGLVQGGGQQQPQSQDQQPELDPFDPRSVQEYIDYKTKQGMSQYEGMMHLVEAQQGEQLARQEIERLQGNLGEFDGDTALLIAAGMLDQGAEPRQALEQAARFLQDYETRIREDERTKQGAVLETHHQAPNEAPAQGAVATPAPRTHTGPGRYEKVVEDFMASRRPSLPVG